MDEGTLEELRSARKRILERLRRPREDEPAEAVEVSAERQRELLADFKRRLETLLRAKEEAIHRFDEDIARHAAIIARLERGAEGGARPVPERPPDDEGRVKGAAKRRAATGRSKTRKKK